MTDLIAGNMVNVSSTSDTRTNANPTQYPPEELGDILSGIPGRLSEKVSVVPAFCPVR